MLCIALAAFAIQRGATLPWAYAPLPDGGQVEITPVGMTERDDSMQIRRDCRWWPTHGDAALCATDQGGEAAMSRLRLAYPLLTVALWVAVAALFVQVLRVPRSPFVRATLTWLVSALCLAAVVDFATSVRPALAVLSELPLNMVRIGVWLIAAATVLSALSGWFHLSHARRSDAAG